METLGYIVCRHGSARALFVDMKALGSTVCRHGDAIGSTVRRLEATLYGCALPLQAERWTKTNKELSLPSFSQWTIWLLASQYWSGGIVESREYWMMYRGPGFLTVVHMICFLAHPLPPSIVSKLSLCLCVSPLELYWRERRGGGAEL
jgi:hypothetical protein